MGRNHPDRAAPCARDLPHCWDGERASRPNSPRPCGSVVLRAGALGRAAPARPIGNLRRVPSLQASRRALVSACMIGTAERMDRIYRSQRFIYDFTRRPYLLGRGALIAGLKPAPGARVLEIGCGTAWNLIRAAELYPAVNFYGLDVSPVMLETAQQSIDTRGLGARIVVCQS